MLFENILQLCDAHREARPGLLLLVKMGAALLERREAALRRAPAVRFTIAEFERLPREIQWKQGTLQGVGWPRDSWNREQARRSGSAALISDLRQFYEEQQKASLPLDLLLTIRMTCALLEQADETPHDREALVFSPQEFARLPHRFELLEGILLYERPGECEQEEDGDASVPEDCSGGWLEIPPRPVWETERLRLRGLRPGDESFLASLDSDPEVMQYIHDGPLPYPTAFRSACRQVQFASHAQLRGKWLVEEREAGAALGWIEIGRLRGETRDFLALGYEFAPRAWGRGVATEAARCVVPYVFAVTQTDQLAAIARIENTASVRVLEKLGFRIVGQRKKNDGIWCAEYRLFRDEWEDSSKAGPEAVERATTETGNASSGGRMVGFR